MLYQASPLPQIWMALATIDMYWSSISDGVLLVQPLQPYVVLQFDSNLELDGPPILCVGCILIINHVHNHIQAKRVGTLDAAPS